MAESKTITIKEIEKTFKNQNELIQYVIMQNRSIMYLTEKVASLEKSPNKSQIQTFNNPVTSIVRSIPEALCQIEIERLMEKAANGPLDFEDTKRLDILMKNYYLAKEKNPPKDEKKEIVLTDEDLIRIAQNGSKSE